MVSQSASRNLSGSLSQGPNRLGSDSLDPDNLGPRLLARAQGNLASPDAQGCRQERLQRGIGPTLHGRSRQANHQSPFPDAVESLLLRPGDHPNGKRDTGVVGLDGEIHQEEITGPTPTSDSSSRGTWSRSNPARRRRASNASLAAFWLASRLLRP